jgi:hypothetical protein
MDRADWQHHVAARRLTRWVALLLAGEMAIAISTQCRGARSRFSPGEASILFCFIFLMLAVVERREHRRCAPRGTRRLGLCGPGGERPPRFGEQPSRQVVIKPAESDSFIARRDPSIAADGGLTAGCSHRSCGKMEVVRQRH